MYMYVRTATATSTATSHMPQPRRSHCSIPHANTLPTPSQHPRPHPGPSPHPHPHPHPWLCGRERFGKGVWGMVLALDVCYTVPLIGFVRLSSFKLSLKLLLGTTSVNSPRAFFRLLCWSDTCLAASSHLVR